MRELLAAFMLVVNIVVWGYVATMIAGLFP